MAFKWLMIPIFVLLFSQNSFSQNDITGNWEGMFYTEASELGQPKLLVEIFSFKDSLFAGLAHLYYRKNKYEHYRIEGRYLEEDSLLIFMEVSTIAVDLGNYGNCLGTYMMKLKADGNYLLMEGIWTAHIRGCADNVKVNLRKKIPETLKEPAPQKKKPAVRKPVVKNKPAPRTNPVKREPGVVESAPPPVKKNTPVIKTRPLLPEIISQRQTDIQSLLEIDMADKDSIRVDIYDNAEIDGDSVSVYENEVQRVYKKRITASPIRFYVSLNKNVNPIVHLRLVAESMGSIPPCTALMIVTTKSKRYEVHLSSNFKKNATVELFLRN
jgi:hypothetical protein